MDQTRPLLWPPNENENPPPFSSSSSGKAVAEVTGDKLKLHDGEGEEDTTMKSIWDLDDDDEEEEEEHSIMPIGDEPMVVLQQDATVAPKEGLTVEPTEGTKKKRKSGQLVACSTPSTTGTTLIRFLIWITSAELHLQPKEDMQRDLDRFFLVFDHLTKALRKQVRHWCYEHLHVIQCVHWEAFFMEYRDYKEGRLVGGKKPRVPATIRGGIQARDIGTISSFEMQILMANANVLLQAEPWLLDTESAISYLTSLAFRELDCCTPLERMIRVREKWEIAKNWFNWRVKAAAQGSPSLVCSSVQPSANQTNTFWVAQEPTTVYDYFRATAQHRISMLIVTRRARPGGSRIGPKYEGYGELFMKSFATLSISESSVPSTSSPPPSDYGDDVYTGFANWQLTERDPKAIFDLPWWPEHVLEWSRSKDDEEIIDVVTCTSPIPAPSDESRAESSVFKVPEVPAHSQSVITTTSCTVDVPMDGSFFGAVPMDTTFNTVVPIFVSPQQSLSTPDNVPVDEEPEEEIDVVMITPCSSPVSTVSHPLGDPAKISDESLIPESPMPVEPTVIHFAKKANSVLVPFDSILPMSGEASIISNRRCIERESAAPVPNADAASAALSPPPSLSPVHSFDDTVRGRKRAASTSSRNGEERQKSNKKKAKRPRSVHSPLVMDRQPRLAAATAQQVIIQQLCDGTDQADRARSPFSSSGSSSGSSPACYSSSSASSPCMSPRMDHADLELIKEAVAPQPSVYPLSTEMLVSPVIPVESGLLLSDSPVFPSEVTDLGNDTLLISPLQVNTLTPSSPAVPSPAQPVTPANSIEDVKEEIKEEVKEEDASPMDTSPPLSLSPLSSQVSSSSSSGSVYALLADEKCPLCEVTIGRYEDRRRHVKKAHHIKWTECACGQCFPSVVSFDEHLMSEKHISILEQKIREYEGLQRTTTSSIESALTAPSSFSSSDSRPPLRLVINKAKITSSLHTSFTPARGVSTKKERGKKRGN